MHTPLLFFSLNWLLLIVPVVPLHEQVSVCWLFQSARKNWFMKLFPCRFESIAFFLFSLKKKPLIFSLYANPYQHLKAIIFSFAVAIVSAQCCLNWPYTKSSSVVKSSYLSNVFWDFFLFYTFQLFCGIPTTKNNADFIWTISLLCRFFIINYDVFYVIVLPGPMGWASLRM